MLRFFLFDLDWVQLTDLIEYRPKREHLHFWA